MARAGSASSYTPAVRHPRKSAPPSALRGDLGGLEAIRSPLRVSRRGALPAGRRVPGRVPGAGLEPARPHWRTRDFKSLASADFAIPAFDSPVFPAPPVARSRFVPRAASRPVRTFGRTIGPEHRAEPRGGTIGREPASSRSAGVLRGPSGRICRAGLSGRIVGPDRRAGCRAGLSGRMSGRTGGDRTPSAVVPAARRRRERGTG